MSANRNSFSAISIREIKGLGLVLERGEEEEVFFQEISSQPNLVDCTYSSSTRRSYFFANPVAEDRIQKFLDAYNAFGKKLWYK